MRGHLGYCMFIKQLLFAVLAITSLQVHAITMVCFPTGQAIPPQEQAQLNCLFHLALTANADTESFEVDTNKKQSGVYMCLINFNLSQDADARTRLVDPAKSGINDPRKLIRAHTYTSADGQIIDAYIYFDTPPQVTDPKTGGTSSLIEVLKTAGLTTTQIANALGVKPVIYSRYSSLVINNLAPLIGGIHTPRGFIAGCKMTQ